MTSFQRCQEHAKGLGGLQPRDFVGRDDDTICDDSRRDAKYHGKYELEARPESLRDVISASLDRLEHDRKTGHDQYHRQENS